MRRVQDEVERLRAAEKQEDLRIAMERRSRRTARTYERGSVALLRRIHAAQREDEVCSFCVCCEP